MARATTVRFTEEIYARLDQASARSGMPVNSIVVAACLEWMQRHTPDPPFTAQVGIIPPMSAAPRWATLRRALGQVMSGAARSAYPFERFTDHAKDLLKAAQAQANEMGHPYIGTEHLLLACFIPGSHSAQVLGALGVKHDVVEAKLRAHQAGERHAPRHRMVPTSRVKKVIELAFATDAERIGTQHILLGLSREGNGIAAHVLNDLDAPLSKIERAVASLKDPES